MAEQERYEILSYEDVEQRQRWQALCQRFENIDIYYLPEYSYLFELNGDGKAYCFVYHEGPKNIVIYPFLIKRQDKLPPLSAPSITSQSGCHFPWLFLCCYRTPY